MNSVILYTRTGEGWRYDLGIVVTIYMVISSLVSLAILIVRRHHEPFKSNGWLLHSISAFGGLFMLEVPLREITGVNSFPCDVYLWMAYLFVPLFATPLIAGAFRLSRYFELQVKKKAIAKAVSVDSEVWKEFEITARRLSEPYYVVWVLLGLVPSFIVIGVLSADEHHKHKQLEGCKLSKTAIYIFVGFGIVFFVAAMLGVKSLVGRHEAFGIRQSYLFTVISTYGWVIVYFILKGMFPDEETAGFNAGYCVVMIPIMWHWHSVILPALFADSSDMWLPPCLKARAVRHRQSFLDEAHNLPQMLDTPLGHVFFLNHLMREFCPESLMFYEAVKQFKTEPRRERAIRIFQKYIKPGSPLEVNLASEHRRLVEQRLFLRPDGTSDTTEDAPPPLTPTSSRDTLIPGPADVHTPPPLPPSPFKTRLVEEPAVLPPSMSLHEARKESVSQVHVSFSSHPSAVSRAGSGADIDPTLANLFDRCQAEVLESMERDSWPRFVASALYQQYKTRSTDRRYSAMSITEVSRNIRINSGGDGSELGSQMWERSRELIAQTQKEDDEYERSRVDPVTAAANTADDNA